MTNIGREAVLFRALFSVLRIEYLILTIFMDVEMGAGERALLNFETNLQCLRKWIYLNKKRGIDEEGSHFLWCRKAALVGLLEAGSMRLLINQPELFFFS